MKIQWSEDKSKYMCPYCEVWHNPNTKTGAKHLHTPPKAGRDEHAFIRDGSSRTSPGTGTYIN